MFPLNMVIFNSYVSLLEAIPNSWLVKISWKIPLKWMITGGSPMTKWKPPWKTKDSCKKKLLSNEE
jgi:hypothetical protein